MSLTEASESRNERKFSSRFIKQVWFFYVIVAVVISPVTHVLIIWGEELQLSEESWKYRRAVLLKTVSNRHKNGLRDAKQLRAMPLFAEN